MRSPCCDKKDVNKGAWTKQEDQKLTDYIRTNGEGSWRSLPRAAGLLRCGKSCRLRWINYLRPGVKRGNFSDDEEDLIVRLHALLGNRWSLIAGRLPGRTDNEVKNYWTSHLRRKLVSMGIDPDNHRLNISHSLPLRRLPQPPQEEAKRLDRVSDAAAAAGLGSSSSLEENSSTCCMQLPDLNLELTAVSFPNSNYAETNTDDHQQIMKEYSTDQEESKRIPPTLLLFI